MICTWEGLELEFHVINMWTSERRRLRMQQQLSERRIRHRFIDAIDGDDAAAVGAAFVCDPDFVPKIYAPRERPISSRELACTLSHMRAIRRAHDMGLREVVICEDDIEIGDVDAGEIDGILAAMPADAAYIQLCTLPATTVRELAKYYIETCQLFAKKSNDQPIRFAEKFLANLGCHSTAAYIVTATGMRNICDRFFDSSRVLFPCHEDEINSNVGLQADRFVYQAAADEQHPGYACCAPTFLIEGVDSLLHPHHVGWHWEARIAAQFCRILIKDKCSIRAT
jgi:GR25 family glycosyltransferase involved in LPS biosynthesis